MIFGYARLQFYGALRGVVSILGRGLRDRLVVHFERHLGANRLSQRETVLRRGIFGIPLGGGVRLGHGPSYIAPVLPVARVVERIGAQSERRHHKHEKKVG